MAKGDLLDSTEEVVRAFYIPYWDETHNRATPSAFVDLSGVSVSRLSVHGYDKIVANLKSRFDGKQLGNGKTRFVKQTGQLSVSEIYRLTDQKIDGPPAQDPPNVCVKVIEDPSSVATDGVDDPSHALIEGWDRATKTTRKELTRTVANRLLRACLLRDVS